MAKMNVTEKDFEAFFQATESLMAMSGTLDEENLGSVQISIPLYVSDIFSKADALIYALFVDDTHRRCGVAKHLLQLAEQQAKLNGVKTIGLEFNKDESDRFVLYWYLRSGYKPFNKKSNLLIKKLED